MAGRDWRAWHDAYDDPGSSLAQRLVVVVQARIAAALDAAPPGPLRAVSMCAGQGRDLLPVLASHARGRDVTARLVELDPGLAATARRAAADAGLPGVEVVTGDASLTDAYAARSPPTLCWRAGCSATSVSPTYGARSAAVPSCARRAGSPCGRASGHRRIWCRR